MSIKKLLKVLINFTSLCLLAQDSEEIVTQEAAENDTAEEKPEIADQQIGKLLTRTRLIASVEDKVFHLCYNKSKKYNN